MRRIGRLMLNALTALSMLLCVVTCVMWARSYFIEDHVRQRLGQWTWSFDCDEGLPVFNFIADTITEPDSYQWQARHGNDPYTMWRPFPICGWYVREQFLNRFGFAVVSITTPDVHPEVPFHWVHGNRPGISVWCHYWHLVCLTAAIPAGRAIARVRRTRRRRRALAGGFCHFCEYNLAGNVSGVCPECGTVPAIPP